MRKRKVIKKAGTRSKTKGTSRRKSIPSKLANPPLQVVILRHVQDADGAVFEQAAERAFKGGLLPSGYLATGEDLGVEIKTFHACPESPLGIGHLFEAACHTLIVAIIDSGALADAELLAWLAQAWNHVQRSQKRHNLLLLTLDERIGDRLRELHAPLAGIQFINPQQLGERAIRAVIFSLRVLHEARLVLANTLPVPTSGLSVGSLRFFISHAKLDGLPLAQSLQHQIQDIPWLQSFYDARDLASETDWQFALETAASSSLLVILRTDAYEQRWWCRQEALWCELHAVPAVLVEARPGLTYPGGDLPLERMSSIRIPDGNLFRVLNAALRESLRYLLFQRRIEEMRRNGAFASNVELRVFSYPPSMPALLRVCIELAVSSKRPKLILYPDPPLRTGIYEAAQALVSIKAPGAQLLTPDTMAAIPTV